MNELMASLIERARPCYELKELERLGLSPDMDLRNRILTHLGLVLRENKAAELISEGDEQQVFMRHFLDSLQPLLLFGFKKKSTILDISAGAGFPSIPIRLFRPDLSFILIEPNRKKAAFLEEVKAILELGNVEIRNCKVEGFEPAKKADYVISRGAWTLQKFAQTARQFVTEHGHMYVYKTKQFPAELEVITSNKDKDGIKIDEIAQYDLGSVVSGLSLVSLGFV